MDGITHINIYSKARTFLGKQLSNFAYSPIEIEGKTFNSIESYWYWLQTHDESLPILYGYQAKQKGRSARDNMDTLIVNPESDLFKEKIKKAIDIKIKSSDKLLKELANSTLPFDHYYLYGTKKVDAGYKWIIDHIENRRKLLKDYYAKNKTINE